MNYLVVFDFETCNMRCDEYSPIQLAAIVLDPRTLEEVEGGRFGGKNENGEDLLMEPLDWSLVEDEALLANGKTREQLENAPGQKVVWDSFVNFMKKYNKDGSRYTRPIPVGHNIINFDIPIIQAMCRKYGNLDSEGKPDIFSSIFQIDVMQNTWWWWESLKEPSRHSNDYICDYFGINKEGAHDAMVDCEHTAMIFRKFLNYYRKHAKKTTFKGCFGEVGELAKEEVVELQENV